MNCALSTAPTLYIVFVWPPNFTMFISIERKTRRFVYLSSRDQPDLLPRHCTWRGVKDTGAGGVNLGDENRGQQAKGACWALNTFLFIR